MGGGRRIRAIVAETELVLLRDTGDDELDVMVDAFARIRKRLQDIRGEP
ncbi:hypothetical protein GCM10008026_01030 [Chelatococcus composti]|nr:hypothetical protein GCM10008026_01030 [Chelatococcus composti]